MSNTPTIFHNLIGYYWYEERPDYPTRVKIAYRFADVLYKLDLLKDYSRLYP